MRQIPQIAIDKAKELEHLELRVYDDQQPKLTLTPETRVIGRLTAGYGHTGSELQIGMIVTEAVADEWLIDDDLPHARSELYGVVSIDAINALTDNQFAALLLFCLNLGADPSWTIWKRLNAKQFDQVPVEMIRFVYEHQGGKAVKVEGLVNRRTAEIRLWSLDEPGSIAQPTQSSVTREIETPPVAVDPTPLHKNGTVLATVGAAVAAAPNTIKGAIDTIQPYSANSDTVAHLVGILAAAAAILALVAGTLLWLKKRNEAK